MGGGMIIGTAGHIDHGKTTLVRALTGVDTDRLPEERRRGITIELGFAPLELAGVGTLSVVDVPGHEAFVRTMVAGAAGVDLALLVIAADEGVMPQTREHVAILELLGVREGVVALTKADLTDPEWLELVREEIAALLAPTAMSDAPIVPVSATTGDGLDALKRALSAAARAVRPRSGTDLLRLPVDRAFSVRGVGTVVTGTLWSGTVSRDATVRVLPSGIHARVRGVQTHGTPVAIAAAGSRVALALAGVDCSEVPRGTVLVDTDAWQPSRVHRADVRLLADVTPVGPRTRVRLHLGTAEVGARVVAAGGSLRQGETRPARILLDAPLTGRAGDRFVLRLASPLVTIGGGVITDPQPAGVRSRLWGETRGPADRLTRVLDEGGTYGVPLVALPVRLGVPQEEVDTLLDGVGAIRLGGRAFAAAALSTASEGAAALVDRFHTQQPLEPGLPLQQLRSQISCAPELADLAIAHAAHSTLEVASSVVRRRGWTPALTTDDQRAITDLHAVIERAGREPPNVSELSSRMGRPVAPLLRLLEREGRLVAVELDRYYARAAIEESATALRERMHPERTYSPAELRELLGVSRKYLIPLLEFYDRVGVTQRRADGRVLGTAPTGATERPY